MLANKPTPAEDILSGKQALYKYYSLGSGCKRNTLRVLRTQNVWCAARSRLNDPFDCYPAIAFPDTEREMEQALRRRVKALHPKATDSLQESIVQRELPKYFPVTNRRAAKFEKDLDDWLDTAGVFCATTTPRNLLMWSHYADCHRGLCIGFRSIACHPTTGQRIAHDVRYTKARPQVNPMKKWTRAVIERCVLRKPTEWSYEEEWRLVWDKGPGELQLRRKHITEVVLGCRIADQDRTSILSLVDRELPHARILQAKLGSRLYGITLVPLR